MLEQINTRGQVMRLIVGPVPKNSALLPEDAGWQRLREPSPDRFIVVATLLSVPIALPGLLMLPRLITRFDLGMGMLSAFAAGLILVILIHEVIHALCYPNGLLSPDTCLGFWPSHLTFYASCDAPMSRNRFLFVLAAPFVAITLLLLTAMISAPPLWRTWLTALNIVHASACTGDFIGIALLLWHVPRGAHIQNNGWDTYWNSQPVAGM